MVDQSPALILILPLFTALSVCLAGFRKPSLCLPLTLFGLAGSLCLAVLILSQVIALGEVQYFLGNWSTPRGIGIEFRIDHLNGLVLVLIPAVALITAVYSTRRVREETPGKAPLFYTLFLLLVTGLLGMTITADAFNLYVLLEVTSLTSYALVAMGSKKRAAMAAFNYIILGTIGASFYLLGVGYLYIKTGTLNMADIQNVLVSKDLFHSQTVHVAFILIVLGLWIKMAFFPLFGWLPNAYSFAPSSTACLVAPLMTKVAIYIMIRMILTVFGPTYVFETLAWTPIVVWLAVIAIIAGSILALTQSDLTRIFSYLIVAEVGYMVGGAWLANHYAMVGAAYHILSDAFMTLCLFLAAGILTAKTGSQNLSHLDGIYRRMPLTMAAFTLAGLSMIGIPPTCGFFSKFYLIRGGIETGHYEYVAALLLSSLLNAIIFFRIFERAYFGTLAESNHASPHQDHTPEQRVAEAPLSMLFPLLLSSASLLLIGLFNQEIVLLLQQTLSRFPIVGGPL